jgi:Ca2+-binding EF-hand superfamily protein
MESQPAVLDSKSTPKTATPSSTADAELEKQARMIFDKFDTNKDGFLTFEELRHVRVPISSR